MKKLLLILLLLPVFANAQVTLRNTLASDGSIRLAYGASTPGDGVFGLYRYVVASTRTDDGKWVIKPTSVDNPDYPDGPLTGRWEYIQNLLEILTMKTVSTATYTVQPSDFNVMLVMTYAGARTVTLPSVSTVNAPVPVWIKDGSNSAGLFPITINSSDSIDNGFNSTVNSNNGVIGLSLNATGTKYLQQ